MSILIVGTSVAGVRTAQALRGHGFDGAITLIGEEPHHPYDKPPLSKEMLGAEGDGAAVPLLSDAELAALDVDLRPNTKAVKLDRIEGAVHTATGDRVEYSELVIATGVTPRTLPAAEGLAGVYTLRTADDARALRSELGKGRRAVVVGAGFIGAEFASAASAHGVEVSVVESQQTPMAHILGADVGATLARLHAMAGVDLHCGTSVSHFTGTGRVTGVALADGRTLPADVVVIGIGARPATGWLEGSGLPIEDGVACDENLRVLGQTGIYAAGDVARWRHPHYEADLRIEHWTNANEHGAIVAAAVVGLPAPRVQVPYVWSDQYGRRIQIVGRPSLGRPEFLDGDIDDGPFVACYVDESGVLVGAVVVDDPRMLMKCRKAIATRGSLRELGIAGSPGRQGR